MAEIKSLEENNAPREKREKLITGEAKTRKRLGDVFIAEDVRLNQPQRTQKTNYTGYGYEDPIVTTRGDAERILQEMSEIIQEYGQASIADLYDLCGITGRPTDMNYGWTEMPGGRSVRIPEGYVIQMPRPICIK